MREMSSGDGRGLTSVDKLPKSSVLYLHASGARYDCQDCAGFIPESQACAIVQGKILPGDSCGYFMPGPPCSLGDQSLDVLSKLEAGYASAVEGASCKRCEYFSPEGDCHLVDKNSAGDDPDEICGDACCVLWEGK